MLPTETLNLTTTNFSPLILEMKERPQLEAWIGYRKLNAVVSGLLLRVRHEWMLVDIEDAPDFVKETILDGLSKLDCLFYERLWCAASPNGQLDRDSLGSSEILEISLFGHDTLAHNQYSRQRITRWLTAAKTIFPSHPWA
jgi:hypothetical protein